MPWGNRWSGGTTGEVEVLKKPSSQVLDTAQSIVLSAAACWPDAVDSPADSTTDSPTGAKRVPAGSILTKVPADPQARYKIFTAAAGEKAEGILPGDVEILDNTATSDEAYAMFWNGGVFDKNHIINYATHAAALSASVADGTMPACSFL